MNKQKIFSYGLAIGIVFLAGTGLSSCNIIDAESDADETAGRQPAIELTFDTGLGTRADGTDYPLTEDQEQVMSTVDLFFYPTGGTNQAPVKTVLIKNTKHDTHHTVSLSDSEFFALFGSSDKTEEGSCVVFAAVNVSDEDYKAAGVDKQSATPAALRKMKVTTPAFAAEFKGGCLAMFSKFESGDEVSYDPSAKKASGKINLQNLAAKIDLLVNFEENVQGVDPNGDKNAGNQSWNVATNNGTPTAEVHILNGVQAVVLGGFHKDALDKEKDYYSIRYNDQHTRGVKALISGDKDFNYNNKTWYATDEPYYSYPNEWEDNPLEQHRTTLLLKVDWTTLDDPEKAGDNDVLTTYYTVPLALDANKLESNKYYRIKVNINTLGGQNFGEPLDIEQASVEVLDWGHAELEADIRELRYLEVSQTQLDRDASVYTAVVNGNNCLVTIPFKSSHNAEIREVSIEYTNFSEFDSYYANNERDGNRNMTIANPGHLVVNPLTPASFTVNSDMDLTNDWQCAYIDNLNHTITVKHKIGDTSLDGGRYKANTGIKFLYSSYLIKITLKHEDSNQHFTLETITIMHHPPIYIEGEVNPGFNDYGYQGAAELGGRSDATKDRYIYGAAQHHHGWVRVNTNNYNHDTWGGVRGIVKANASPANWGDNSSDNPIMYLINVTQLDPGSKYHIRDPRVTVENHELGATWALAPHYVNGSFEETENKHTLTSYYPTDETEVDEIMYAISPRFRIQSAFGIVDQHLGFFTMDDHEISQDEARRRCASYCEAGYPAGRWRLPTLGEMEFVQGLSRQGVIPYLFGVNEDYVTAHGVYKFDNSGNKSGGKVGDGRVRCVYDDWYWVKKDGSPDKLRYYVTQQGSSETNVPFEYDFTEIYNNGQVFVWGDKPKNNPQEQPVVQEENN